MSPTHLVERLVLPPGGCLVLLAAGWVLGRRWPRLGRACLVLAFLTLWLSSTPWIGAVLIRAQETTPAFDPVRGTDAEAIVVLGAGVEGETPEYGGLVLGPLSLERVRWAARLQRMTGLPIALTGGSARPDATPVAELMREVLVQDLGVPVRWTEGDSATTWENAALSRKVLSAEGVDRVLLVTHAWHMPRAVMAFEAHGFEVVPAPTMFHGPPPEGLDGWIPTSKGLRHTTWALHEMIGRVVYGLRDP